MASLQKIFRVALTVVFGISLLLVGSGNSRADILFDGSVKPKDVNDIGFNDPDFGGQRIAEDFGFTGSVIVEVITFLGGYYPTNTPETDSFTLTIYNDEMGLPDPLSIVAQVDLGDFGRTDTGVDVFGIDLYSYTTSFAGLLLSGDTPYWLTIVNDTTGDTNDDWVLAGNSNVGIFGRSFDGGVSWFDTPPGSFSFILEDTADDGTFIVEKFWDVIGEGGNQVPQDAVIRISCNGEISPGGTEPDNCSNSTTCTYSITGNQTISAVIDISEGEVVCSAEEIGISDDAIDVDDVACGEPHEIGVGETESCTITNTIFFEGIPVLNQYGLALMALLMLGVGFVGFRRFA